MVNIYRYVFVMDGFFFFFFFFFFFLFGLHCRFNG